MDVRARVHERGKTKNKGWDKNQRHGRLKREHEYPSRSKSLQVDWGGDGVVILWSHYADARRLECILKLRTLLIIIQSSAVILK